MLDYEEFGQGSPVILIHGFMGTGMTDFYSILGWLSKIHKIYLPTLRGYGNSKPKPRKFDKNFYITDAKDIIHFTKKLKLKKPILMGYSDGGEAALVAATLEPDLFKSVLTWGSVGFCGPKVAEHSSDMLPTTWLTDDIINTHALKDPEDTVKDWIKSVNEMCELGTTGSDPEKIVVPVLMLLGDKDNLNPKEYAKKFVKGLRKGKLKVISGHHDLHVDRPEEFKKIVNNFV